MYTSECWRLTVLQYRQYSTVSLSSPSRRCDRSCLSLSASIFERLGDKANSVAYLAKGLFSKLYILNVRPWISSKSPGSPLGVLSSVLKDLLCLHSLKHPMCLSTSASYPTNKIHYLSCLIYIAYGGLLPNEISSLRYPFRGMVMDPCQRDLRELGRSFERPPLDAGRANPRWTARAPGHEPEADWRGTWVPGAVQEREWSNLWLRRR